MLLFCVRDVLTLNPLSRKKVNQYIAFGYTYMPFRRKLHSRTALGCTRLYVHWFSVCQESTDNNTVDNKLTRAAMGGTGSAEMQFDEIRRGLEEGSLVYLDVRNVDELKNDGKIKGSVCVPLPEIKEAFQLSPDDFQARYHFTKPATDASNVVVACRSGRRAGTAISALKELGYSNLRLYTGSFLEWQSKGGPLE